MGMLPRPLMVMATPPIKEHCSSRWIFPLGIQGMSGRKRGKFAPLEGSGFKPL